MFDQPAVFVDVETNGQMGERGRIIEIAMIRVEYGETVEEFTSLVNPGSSIPYWIEKLTGISNTDISDAPYFDDIAEKLKELSHGAIFVAHNVRFDYSFIKSHFAATGYDYRPKMFCTVRMSRGIYPDFKGHSLEKIIKRHNIDVESRHRAYDDALAIYKFTKLAIAERGDEAFADNVRLQLKTKSLPPNVSPSVVDNLPEAPGIYIFRDQDGAPLYIGKSVNIRDRVRSHFTNDTRIVKEMKLSQRSYSIDYEATETEIEALLLESTRIKTMQPLFNRLLRRRTQQSVLMKQQTDDNYTTIAIESRDLSDTTDLNLIYGVYTSRIKAKKSLESLARTYQLCPKLLSLEKPSGACFRYQLGLCRGACIGKESADSYNQRVDYALSRARVESWPFKSKIALKISDSKSLIIDQWVIEGVLHTEAEPHVERLSSGFDIDTYKILRSYIRRFPSHIIPYFP